MSQKAIRKENITMSKIICIIVTANNYLQVSISFPHKKIRLVYNSAPNYNFRQ